jgi:hypothetical protein
MKPPDPIRSPKRPVGRGGLLLVALGRDRNRQVEQSANLTSPIGGVSAA